MNMKEVCARSLMVAGLATAGSATVDFSQNKGFFEELREDARIEKSLAEKYDITIGECARDACAPDTVNGDLSSKEKKEVLDEFYKERSEKFEEVRNPAAEKRGVLEIAGFVTGVSAALTGKKILEKNAKKK